MSRALHLLLAGLAVAAFAWACAKRDGSATTDDGANPIDVEVMAFLSEARSLHHQANVKEETGDLPGAVAAIDRLVAAKRPHAGQTVPEVEEVIADAHARQAELRLRSGDFDGAARAVTEGLSHAPEPTYFRGHLLEVDGLVEEARGAYLADGGKPDEASRARAHAIELLEQAVRVQEQVVSHALSHEAGTGAR